MMKIKLPELDEREREQFAKAGLTTLYEVFQKQIDEEIALEAVANYNKAEQQSCIKGVTIKVTQELLRKALKLPEEATGHLWSSEQVIAHLGETEEQVLKRKKGAQGIPTQSI